MLVKEDKVGNMPEALDLWKQCARLGAQTTEFNEDRQNAARCLGRLHNHVKQAQREQKASDEEVEQLFQLATDVAPLDWGSRKLAEAASTAHETGEFLGV